MVHKIVTTDNSILVITVLFSVVDSTRLCSGCFYSRLNAPFLIYYKKKTKTNKTDTCLFFLFRTLYLFFTHHEEKV